MNYISPNSTYRAIWISDVHLGTRGCQADILLDFLRHTESEYLYLVGDIIDGWRLRRYSHRHCQTETKRHQSFSHFSSFLLYFLA